MLLYISVLLAGIYIHIPFCKKKCYYCDFFTSQNLSLTNNFLLALFFEINSRKDYLLADKIIETIYFGGGTPTTLKSSEIELILNNLKFNFNIPPNIELAIEANPDDLSEQYLEELIKLGFNRISIGIQSFNDEMLALMNRRHNSENAINSVENAQKAGFDNISVDLIYGLPKSNVDFLKKELESLLKLNVQHISAYHLTYETNTIFGNYLKKGKVAELPDFESQNQYKYLTKFLEGNGFEQYEISNFAKNGKYSKHNSNYWLGKEYIGFGPSAHSYNTQSRQWNVSNIKNYISEIENNKYFEIEILSTTDKFNEYLITKLRTKWGVDLERIKKDFGQEYFSHLMNAVNKKVERKCFLTEKNILYLCKECWFLSDGLILDLIYT